MHAIALRPLGRDDLPLLAQWLGQPHVARWWSEPADLATVEERYLPCIEGQDPTELFVIEAGGGAAGMIQRYLVRDDPEWARVLAATGSGDWSDAAGIDYLIGDVALTGQGIGTAVIRDFTGMTFDRYPQAARVSAAVQQANPPSWRALERAGFTRCWAGQLDSGDPSDAGPSYLYAKPR